MTSPEGVPTEMRSLVAPKFTVPSGFALITLPTPTIFSPTDALIHVHAASINPIDVKKALGISRFMESFTFPHKLGLDASGTVVQVGDEVTDIAVGDDVYFMLTGVTGGTASEYVVTPAQYISRKPRTISHTLAASLPIVSITSLQALEYGASQLPGGLEGKTVFIPAALSGTGSIAIQLAKHVFKAGKVITTASTGKIALIQGLLGEGTVDQVIDYTIQDVFKEIPAGSVDMFYDTMGQSFEYISLVKPGTGIIVSISTVFSGDVAKQMMPGTPWVIEKLLNVWEGVSQWKARRWGVKYGFFTPDIALAASDLKRLAEWVDEGTLKPVVGSMANLDDLAGVIDGCTRVYSGKGGVGKFVIEID